MCAVAVLEAKFVNIAERSPVDVGKIPLQRFRLVRITCAASVVSLVHSESEGFCLSHQTQVILVSVSRLNCIICSTLCMRDGSYSYCHFLKFFLVLVFVCSHEDPAKGFSVCGR